MDTVHSLVIMHGEVDLKTEQLDLRADPEAKGVTLSVATPVVVHGSLWNPKYTVLKGELFLTLTDLTAKAALPPLILLDAFGDAVAENRCVAVTAGKVPDKRLFRTVESLTGGPGKVVQGVGETVVEATEAVVGGVGGAVVEGGAAVLKGIGNALSGDVGEPNKPQSERAGSDAVEVSSKPLKKSPEPTDSPARAPEIKESLFLQ